MCPCWEGCPYPDCDFGGLNCACPVHGVDTGYSLQGYPDSCDRCSYCTEAQEAERQ